MTTTPPPLGQPTIPENQAPGIQMPGVHTDTPALANVHAHTSVVESLARMHHVVEQGGQIALLLGHPHGGKSRTLQLFADQIRAARAKRHTQVTLLRPAQGWNSHRLLLELAESLGTLPDQGDSPTTLWRRIVDRICENGYQKIQTVLLCDDVGRTEFASTEIWHKLIHAGAINRAGWAPVVILALNEQQLSWLGHELLERCDIRIELERESPLCETPAASPPRTSPAAATRPTPGVITSNAPPFGSTANLGGLGLSFETTADLAYGLS